ncbi:MAG TPA: hypothetical protein DHW85_06795 [Lachnospiraceae bacterium]|nr:hypothetical protein [Lachnospiraceae bacterium]
MSKTDSITLWRSRIQSRKLSGLKVNDWCEQNSISRHAYYYWYRKLKDIKKEQGDVFAEVMLEPASMIPIEKTAKPEILITWKDFSISITDQHAIPMAAELLSRLEKQC